MFSLRLAAPALVVPLVLAGCADDEPDRADPTPGSPTGSATPTIEYPAEGVDLKGTPALEGVYQRAMQTYIDFERGRRQAARDGAVGRLLTFNAVADVVDPYREALRNFGRGGYAGDVAIEFLGAAPRGSRLLLEVCVDGTLLEVPDGAPTLLGEPTRAPQQVDVTNVEGLWRVTRAEPVDGSC